MIVNAFYDNPASNQSEKPAFHLKHMLGGLENRVGIKAHRVDADFHQMLGHLGIVRRRLATQTRMPAITFGAFHRQANHLFHTGVALIKIKGNNPWTAIHAQSELGQIIGANGEAVKQFGESINLNNIVGDLAHNVDIQAIFSTLEAVMPVCFPPPLYVGLIGRDGSYPHDAEARFVPQQHFETPRPTLLGPIVATPGQRKN